MRIFLTGFMGSGKTTVGRILAQKLGWEFIDLDQEIERSAKNSIPAIFERSGEEEFRKLETLSLKSIKQDSVVVATGGGCFLANQEWMLNHGTVIYLKAPFEILASRVRANASRPLWKNAEKLFHERERRYENAHLNVDASFPADQIVSEILRSGKFKSANSELERIPES